LSFASTMLNQYKNIGIFSTFSGAVQKIVDAVNIRRLLKEESSFPFVQFENVPVMKGSEFIPVIIEALKTKKVVDIRYQRFDAKKAHDQKVHPYLLKEYRNRWYLIGLNNDLQEIRTYCLDRTQDIRIHPEIPFRETGFDPSVYFRSSVGIIAPSEEPMNVQLKFTRQQGLYVIAQPIHDSQEVIEESAEHILISLRVAHTWELVSMILGWGPEVEVTSPEDLVKEIIELHRRSWVLYGK
jgi:predicted DNA-binding transcriptional regulator YafY